MGGAGRSGSRKELSSQTSNGSSACRSDRVGGLAPGRRTVTALPRRPHPTRSGTVG